MSSEYGSSEYGAATYVTWSTPPTPDPMKNDYQNARRRTLHGWALWRTEVNKKLCDTAVSGDKSTHKVSPIKKFLRKQVPPNHPAEKPKTLLSYSAAQDSETTLRKTNFLMYGLPRVKLEPKRPSASDTSSASSVEGY